MNLIQRRTLQEIALAMGVASALLFAIDRLAALVPWLASVAGLFSALTFALVPSLALRWGARRDLAVLDDPLGIDRAPLLRGVGLGVAVSLVVLPIFAVGLDVLQVQVLHHRRLDLSALQSAGIGFQGRGAETTNRVVLLDDLRGLAVENHRAEPVRVVPHCSEQPACAARLLPPGGRLLLAPIAATEVHLQDLAGHSLSDAAIIAGASGEPQDNPVHAAPGLTWILLWLVSQLLVVALPEEMFFRGYVLGRLRAAFPPQRALFGVPFGRAHVISAVLFALIHLVLVPAPQRLLVFFPGLLFAWLTERSRGTFASTTHHALANVCQTALLLLYAPH